MDRTGNFPQKRPRAPFAERLHNTTELLTALVHASPLAIIVVDPRGIVRMWNPAAERTFGWTDQEVLGRPNPILRENSRNEFGEIQERVLRGETLVGVEARRQKKDGALVDVSVSTASLRDARGKVTGRVIILADTTEQKRIEVSLQESARRAAAILQSALDCIITIDHEGKIIEFNPAAEETFGYARADVVGKSLAELIIPPSLRERHRQGLAHYLATGEGPVLGKRIELTAMRADGTEFPVELFITRIQVEGPPTFTGFLRDLTERRRAEKAIQESAKSFQLMFANNPLPMWTYDVETLQFLEVNEAAIAQYGYSRKDFLAMRITDIRPSEDVPRLLEDISRNRPGLQASGEWRHRRKDGRLIDVQIASHVLDFAGRKASLVVASDITQRKQAEQEVRESAESFHSLFNATSEGIAIHDRGAIVVANQTFAEISGYALSELVGKPAVEIIAPESRALVLEHARSRSQKPLETIGQRKDGSTFFIEITHRPILYKGQKRTLTTTRDITERKRAEEEVWRARDAEQANQAKSEFLSRMSHELRTPLNAVLGFAQLLEMNHPTPEQRENVGYIIKAGRHLLELINEVLDIARIEAGRLALSLEPIFVQESIRETLDLIRPLAAEENITLNVEEGVGPRTYIVADRQRIKQVLLNILANAIKYNRKGGTVTISWKVASEDRLQISVQDTGPGIPPEKLQRLFTPFERLGADGVEGTGLGLALSKRLVEAMGGGMGVKSVVDQGSTFWIEFALAEGPLQQVERQGEKLPQQAELQESQKARIILYIEDNLSNLKLIQRLLVHRPEVRLIPAMQGRLGLDLAREHRPDLILLDLHLPDLPGEAILRRLQEVPETSHIPVIVISADATAGQIKRLSDAGAYDYLTKPIDVKRFLDLISKVLEERAHSNE